MKDQFDLHIGAQTVHNKGSGYRSLGTPSAGHASSSPSTGGGREETEFAKHVKKFHWTRSVLAGSGKLGGDPEEGDARNADMWQPFHAVHDGQGGFFVSDRKNHVIRHVDQRSRISVVAGRVGIEGDSGTEGGDAVDSLLSFPKGLAIFPKKPGLVWFCDSGNHAIRVLRFPVSASDGVTPEFDRAASLCTIISRKHKGLSAPSPSGDGDEGGEGEHSVEAENEQDALKTAVLAKGPVEDEEIVRQNQNVPASKVRLKFPSSLAFDLSGNLYISDTGNNCIRRMVSDESLSVSVVVGVPGRPGCGTTNSDSSRSGKTSTNAEKGAVRIGLPQQIVVCPDFRQESEERIRSALRASPFGSSNTKPSSKSSAASAGISECLIFAEADVHCVRLVRLKPYVPSSSSSSALKSVSMILSFETLVGRAGEVGEQSSAIMNRTRIMRGGIREHEAGARETETARQKRKEKEAVERRRVLEANIQDVRLNVPMGLAADEMGRRIAISERNGGLVRLIDFAEGEGRRAKIISGDPFRQRNYLDKSELLFSETQGACRFLSWWQPGKRPEPGQREALRAWRHSIEGRIAQGFYQDEGALAEARGGKGNQLHVDENTEGNNLFMASPKAAEAPKGKVGFFDAPSQSGESTRKAAEKGPRPVAGVFLAHENIVTLVWERHS